MATLLDRQAERERREKAIQLSQIHKQQEAEQRQKAKELDNLYANEVKEVFRIWLMHITGMLCLMCININ